MPPYKTEIIGIAVESLFIFETTLADISRGRGERIEMSIFL